MIRRLLLLLLLAAGCVEQPKPQPIVRKPSLYSRIGGYNTLEKIVDDFARHYSNDPRFKDPAFKRRLIGALGAALGGPWHEGAEDLHSEFLGGGDENRRHLTQAIRAADLGERSQKEVLAALRLNTTP